MTKMQECSSPQIHGSAFSESVRRAGPCGLNQVSLAFNTNAYYDVTKAASGKSKREAGLRWSGKVTPRDATLGLGQSKGRAKGSSVAKNLAEDAFGKVKKIRGLGEASNQM